MCVIYFLKNPSLLVYNEDVARLSPHVTSLMKDQLHVHYMKELRTKDSESPVGLSLVFLHGWKCRFDLQTQP